MTARKRASLHRETNRAAGSSRRPVTIDGRCSIGGREAQTVLVTDLGATGCRVLANAVGVSKSDSLELWLGDAGPLAGRLKWIKDGAFGIAFDRALDAAQLAHLYEASDSAKIVPLRK